MIFPSAKSDQRQHYANFKMALDQFLGIKSICMCESKIMSQVHEEYKKEGYDIMDDKENLTRSRELVDYFRNLSMELNLRFGNSNHTIQSKLFSSISEKPRTIILGADVTHPAAGSSSGVPSVAAFVGNVDAYFNRFSGSMRLNPPRQDIISGMQEMAHERLLEWTDKHGRLPRRILFYRDGVGDNQFAAVREREVTAIRAAWEELPGMFDNRRDLKTPEITAVVVTLGHHTRL